MMLLLRSTITKGENIVKPVLAVIVIVVITIYVLQLFHDACKKNLYYS